MSVRLILIPSCPSSIVWEQGEFYHVSRRFTSRSSIERPSHSIASGVVRSDGVSNGRDFVSWRTMTGERERRRESREDASI